MITLDECTDHREWDGLVTAHDGHPLQLWGWGEVKAAHGWRVVRLRAMRDGTAVGGAQMLVRSVPFPLRAIAYLPRGPIGVPAQTGELLEAVAAYARTTFKAVVLTIEPDWEELPTLPARWSRSDNAILMPHTLILDLTRSEDELMSDMSKKTRQYIRKSGREEQLQIRQVTEVAALDGCLDVYRETAHRADFALHGDAYYRDVFTELDDASPVFAAYAGEEPVAFLWLATSAATTFELYGGMNDLGQKLRANYALKWHAITAMKARGVTRYDLNGLVSEGVSTFKQGFAGHENLLVGSYDRPLSPLYPVWARGLPLARKALRKLRR
ncbi:lipid II:glycine glycyltransferase FemX [Rudaeicoccus suwonensis]|uniref:Lipid II:glycine glycyltransferase (Peptidoglycan interpeptide bridge formation enzyme) n=1 Tax=Rudaeicoccus suwonensis TaxID=657409 RepID=A0A561E9Z9_9MICO|nr:peptidoglycan bridge formation glycyltransferase FemA/FemB family protein [Rudaeicoccus suwonensis]TWE12431.1 lipid II:glycine glycyltransferase (peptidoglycan interpeptide bridge formation enzyme) [Rudaeicoccus suwonensis]